MGKILVLLMLMITSAFAGELRFDFTHLRKGPEVSSPIISTFICGEKATSLGRNGIWLKVKVGGLVGFIMAKAYSKNKVSCLRKKSSRFFDSLNLSMRDIYVWGKLSERWIEGETDDFN